AREVAAFLGVEPAAAALEEVDLVARRGDLRTRPRIPAAVTLDAVEEDDAGHRLDWWGVAAIAPEIAVGRRRDVHGRPARFVERLRPVSQSKPPFAPPAAPRHRSEFRSPARSGRTRAPNRPSRRSRPRRRAGIEPDAGRTSPPRSAGL